MNKIFTKKRLKIFLIVFFSYLMVKTAAPQIFLGQTPKINPLFVYNLKNAPQNLAELPSKMIARLNNLFPKKSTPTTSTSDQLAEVKTVTPPPNVIFKTITKGVYAGEDPKTGQAFIKIEAGTKYRITGTVTINGKEYPKIEFIE